MTSTVDYWAPPVGIDVDPPEAIPGVDPSDALQVLAPGMFDADKGAWLATRRTGIGASDVSGILGLASSRTSSFEVYADKRGEIPWTDPDTDASRLGTILEPVVRQLYTADRLPAHAHISTHGGTLRSVRWPWLMCNPDGIIRRRAVEGRTDGGWPREGFESKTTTMWLAHEWEGDQVPDHAEIQCQVVMAVCGFVGMHVGCLIGGQRPVYRYVERDDELIRDLVEITEEFWHDHVLTGVPPDPDASVALAEFLTRKHPRVVSTLPPVVADDATVAKIVGLRQNGRAANTYVKAEDEAKNVARQLIGDAEELHDTAGRCVATWRQTGRFDAATFTQDHPEVAEEFTRQVSLLDTEALAQAHPELYARYRGRVLLVK